MYLQTHLAADIRAVASTVEKIGAETRQLLARIAELQASIGQAGAVAPEVSEALAALQAQVAVVDALVPDAPVTADTPADPAPPAAGDAAA